MTALSALNIESELSYAYLHAIASRAGVNCKIGNRHDDNAGVDACLTSWGPFENGGYLTEVELNVQLKATIQAPTNNGTHFSYFLSGKERYNALRCQTQATPRILVVLFLPPESEAWLLHSADQLIIRKCAYWVSLRGAQETDNVSGVTIKVPKIQVFSPESLTQLMTRLSRRDYPCYEKA
jgi:hypothetical protein